MSSSGLQRRYGDCFEASLVNAEELQQIKDCVEIQGVADPGLTKLYGQLGLVHDIEVVHGTVIPPIGPDAGRVILHAWIEVGDGVIETSNGQRLCYPRSDFYAEFRLVPLHRYSPAEARALAVAHGQYAAWHILPTRLS